MTQTVLRLSQSWRGDLIALVAGMLLPLAFAPVGYSFLALLSPALLFLIWLMTPGHRRSAWRGWLFGLGSYGVGISWVFVSIHYHGFVPLLLSLFLTVLLVAFMALFPALVGYGIGRWFPHSLEGTKARYKLLLVMPAAWVLIEWVRGWFMTGFPWLALGYSQTDTALAGYAPVLGVYGLSLIVALMAALLVLVLMESRSRWYALGGVIGLWLLGMLLHAVDWTKPHGKPMGVALLQGNIPQDLKWLPEVRQPTIDLYSEMTRHSWEADLIVWPETALPDFYHKAEDVLDELEQGAREHNTALLIGVIYSPDKGRSYYNSMVTLGVGEREFYHKQHLVPFTEYLPLKWLLGALVQFMQVPMSDFGSGGLEQPPLEVDGQRVGISICFEDAFGEEVIRALPEATLLVNVSNDAWFDDSWAPPQHLQIARMRAIETGRPLLRATNTGVSATVDHKGTVRQIAPQFDAYILKDNIQPMQGMTPYAYFGNSLIVVVVLLMLVVGRQRLAAQTAS